MRIKIVIQYYNSGLYGAVRRQPSTCGARGWAAAARACWRGCAPAAPSAAPRWARRARCPWPASAPASPRSRTSPTLVSTASLVCHPDGDSRKQGLLSRLPVHNLTASCHSGILIAIIITAMYSSAKLWTEMSSSTIPVRDYAYLYTIKLTETYWALMQLFKEIVREVIQKTSKQTYRNKKIKQFQTYPWFQLDF